MTRRPAGPPDPAHRRDRLDRVRPLRPGHRPPPARLGHRPLRLRPRGTPQGVQRHLVRPTQFRYDAAGQLVEVTNANGGTTRYDYDDNGRVTTITDPLGGATGASTTPGTTWSPRPTPRPDDPRRLRPAGRQTSQTDATGRTTTWAFDTSGRVESVSVDGAVVSSIERNIRARRVIISDHTRTGSPAREHVLEWNPRGQLVRRARTAEPSRGSTTPTAAAPP
ncbi:RHS repeat domain-containing protein [Nocardioides ungokensis]|uniref:RHS repeat domain-containing protein n=1 Tax=Nocardioides ungokensis TaxID=1643322 RepID=UPI0015E04FF7|nr:RHS repeat domain-containing protein [Nocardioides ungokensis]